MSEQNAPTTTTPAPATNPLTPEQQEALAVMAKQIAEQKAEAAHRTMVDSLQKTNENFKILYEKYKDEIFTLNPTLKNASDPNQFLTTFTSSANVLFERDKKIASTPAPAQPANPTPTAGGGEPLDKPIALGNGVFKNAQGKYTDANGTPLLSEHVKLPDVRNMEIPADASNVDKARLLGMREAQKQVQRFEYPTW